MALIILGIIIFGVTGILVKNNPMLLKYRNTGRFIGLAVIAIGIVISSIVQILKYFIFD